MKLCKRCGETKAETEFPKSSKSSDGLYTYCKKCSVAKTKANQAIPPRRTPPPGLKWCSDCKADIPLNRFNRRTGTYDGLDPICKEHRFERHNKWRKANLAYCAEQQRIRVAAHPDRYADYERKKNYGLAPGEYHQMLEAQGGRCAICGTDDPSPRKNFSVDHCHNTKVVRALLCTGCNAGIGHLRHSKKILLAAMNYLERYS